MNVSILRKIYFTFKHNLLYSHKPEWKTEFIMLYTRKPYTKSINSCPPRGSDLKAEPNSHIFFQSFESWLFQYDVMHSIWSLSLSLVLVLTWLLRLSYSFIECGNIINLEEGKPDKITLFNYDGGLKCTWLIKVWSSMSR